MGRITVQGKCVYLHLDKPSKPEGSTNKEKYSLVLLFKSGGAVEKVIEAERSIVVQEELDNPKSKWKGRVPDNALNSKVIRDAWDYFQAEWAEGYRFITPKSAFSIPIINEELQKIEATNEELVYDGMIANVCITLYGYSVDSGGKGVATFLNSVQVLGKGKRLELKYDPKKDFEKKPIVDDEEEDYSEYGCV